MEKTIDIIKEQIETLKKQRNEIGAVLIGNRENVIGWLEVTIHACQREIYQVKENGDIADGEIQSPWNLLHEAIAGLRETQDLLRRNTDFKAEAESELADLELGPF